MKGKLTLLVMSALLLGIPSTFAKPRSSEPLGRWVTVTIHRLKEISNLDKDFPRKDQADFFAQIWIAGKATNTRVMSKDDGWPNWRVRGWVPGNTTKIKIRIMDDDGGMEEDDDHVDVAPRIGDKDLDLTFNAKTGRVTGDVRGRRNQRIHARGGGEDSDKAEIWFSIR